MKNVITKSLTILTFGLSLAACGTGPATTPAPAPAPAKVSTLDATRVPLFVGYSTVLTGVTATPGANVTVGVKFNGNMQAGSWVEQPDLTVVTVSDAASGTFKTRVNFAGLKVLPTAVQLYVGDGNGTIFGGAQSDLDNTGLSK